jgi:DNA-binding transcriptional ArsR family regulator
MADDADEETGLSPAEAFAILGNGVRIAILRALVDGVEETPASFSALRDAVGIADSGRFNYHLQQLTDHFLEREAGGYALRYPGRKVAHAVLAGTFNERAAMDPVSVEGACHACGAEALVAAYADERLTVECDACAEPVVLVPFPPSAVSSRPPEAVPAAFDRWSTRQAALATDGVCPDCAGSTEGAVTTEAGDSLGFEALARFECTVCRRSGVLSFGGVALQHPEVLAFHHRRDEFPLDRPYWTVPQFVTDEHTTIESRDPWRVRVEFPVAGDVLEARVDGSLDVVATRVR